MAFGPNSYEYVCMQIDTLSSNSVGFRTCFPFVFLVVFRNVITILLSPQGNILNHSKYHTSVAKKSTAFPAPLNISGLFFFFLSNSSFKQLPMFSEIYF